MSSKLNSQKQSWKTRKGASAELKENKRLRNRKLELEVLEKEGKLINVNRVAPEWFKKTRTCRDNLLNMPTHLSSQIAGKTEPEIKQILSKAINEALEALD